MIGNRQGGEEWAREWETQSKSKDETNKERTSMREICVGGLKSNHGWVEARWEGKGEGAKERKETLNLDICFHCLYHE